MAWLGRATQPERLDFEQDRLVSFRAWKLRWDDFFLLSGLDQCDKNVQMAALRSCLSDDVIKLVSQFSLTEAERNNIHRVLKLLEEYAKGQVNEVLERRRFNQSAAAG